MNKDYRDKSQYAIKEQYSFAELLNLVRFLQSPEGCPWDKVQTHESIQGSLVEEAWEAVDAIKDGRAERLSDELGDVLLQVLFHAEIARKAGSFDIEDVKRALAHKLISRHTHIFAEDTADNPDSVIKTWESNKKSEKGLHTETDVLRDVPKSLPALTRAYKLQKKAANCGFDWPDTDGCIEKIKEEATELKEAKDAWDKQVADKGEFAPNEEDMETRKAREHLQEEAGDLLFAMVNLLRKMKIDPELALHKCSEKFLIRFARMEDLALEQGHELRQLDLEAMDKFWDEAKAEERM